MSCTLPSRPGHRPTAPRGSATAAALLAMVLAATACSASGGEGAQPTVGAPTAPVAITAPPGFDPGRLEPLAGLGPCEASVTPAATAPDGLVLPPGAVVTARSSSDAVVNLQGYVPYTPVQSRVFYEQLDDVEVLESEDEVHEAEVLLRYGDRRLFVKIQAVCAQGSALVAVDAPESAAEQVPEPAGDDPEPTE